MWNSKCLYLEASVIEFRWLEYIKGAVREECVGADTIPGTVCTQVPYFYINAFTR